MRRAALICIASVVAGCGFGAGDEKEGGAELRVTRDFGRVAVKSAKKDTLRETDTVMRFLQSQAKVETRYGGNFVQSINGVAGKGSDGRSDWFYFVNGIWAPSGAAERALKPGDVVQWDYRNWESAPRVPAIVGAFPEPFLHGNEGKRIPTRIECVTRDAACDEVVNRLTGAGVAAGLGTIGAEARGEVLRVEVGRWSDLRRINTLAVLEKDPARSGVYARFAGDRLQLLERDGETAQEAGPGAGLLAAIRPAEQEPVWVVTGIDDAGVMRAARLLDAGTLRNAYAVAALAEGPQRLPVGGGR